MSVAKENQSGLTDSTFSKKQPLIPILLLDDQNIEILFGSSDESCLVTMGIQFESMGSLKAAHSFGFPAEIRLASPRVCN